METILRVCCLGPEGVEIPIYVSDRLSRCKWIVVTHVDAGPPADPETYITYFLDPTGHDFDFAQRDTLQEALDTAKILSQAEDLRWVECKRVRASETFNSGMLQQIWDRAG